MTPAFTFATPLLLLGLLAAAAPVVIHLVSRARAQEVYFPSLRFLRMSMERTARRRKFEHLLLMLLRMLVLALLAVAVAEPISEAVGGWLGGRRYAAVVILDNSMSMGARGRDGDRFSHAMTDAASLLGGDYQPSVAGLITTNGGFRSESLTGELAALRRGLQGAEVAPARASIEQCYADAAGMLLETTAPQKSIYILSDMQRASFEQLLKADPPPGAEDIHTLIVNTSPQGVTNVGVTDLKISGRKIVDEVVEFTARLENSSEAAMTVDVVLRVGGEATRQRARKTLSAAGEKGSAATVKFRHRFTEAGPVLGEVMIETPDDLAADNVRRFALDIGQRARALVVRGAFAGGGRWTDPSAILALQLQPYEPGAVPWPVTTSVVDYDELTAGRLAVADAAFFCNVPSFTAEQASAVADFVRRGGTAVFFMGPNVQADNYNRRFVQDISSQGGLLPGRLGEPVGQIGPDAPAAHLEWIDTRHEYFSGLYENPDDYPTVLAQRYYRLKPAAGGGQTLMQLADEAKSPLVIRKPFGRGGVVLCTTTASPRWSNLCISPLFLPMVNRATLLAAEDSGRVETYLAGSPVTIRVDVPDLPSRAVVSVTPPGEQAEGASAVTVPQQLKKTEGGYAAVFEDTGRLGRYRWKVVAPGLDDAEAPSGAFVVNPPGTESDLRTIDAGQFAETAGEHGLGRVYTGATLGEVNAAASAAAQGKNWWDLVTVIAIVVLVVEVLVSNWIRGSGEDEMPAELNPRVAGRAG